MAEGIKVRVEHLVASKASGIALDGETARWVAEISPELAEKLAKVELIPRRETSPETALEPFLWGYLDGMHSLKPATKIIRGQVIRDLAEFFGAARDVASIGEGDADDLRQWLAGRKRASTTIHKRLQVARSFFKAMRRRKLIDANPFDGVSAPAAGIRDRQRYVSAEEAEQLLRVADPTWRTIIALARYAGLRCPSEVLSLRWQDVDFAEGRIVVTSPKTEHHAEGGSRTIPLFARLRPILEEAFELAPVGAEYVVDPRYRQAAMGPNGWINVNLRTQMLWIVRCAGLKPWPRLFHNLRASLETDLASTFPIHTVVSWLGNTPKIAMRHYLMVTEGDFRKAIENSAKSNARPAEKAAQNPTLHAAAQSSTSPQETSKAPAVQGLMQSGDPLCELVPETGVEWATLPSNALRCAGNCARFITPKLSPRKPIVGYLVLYSTPTRRRHVNQSISLSGA